MEALMRTLQSVLERDLVRSAPLLAACVGLCLPGRGPGRLLGMGSPAALVVLVGSYAHTRWCLSRAGVGCHESVAGVPFGV